MLIKGFFVIEINHSSLRRDNLCIKDHFLSLLQEPSNVSRSMRNYRELQQPPNTGAKLLQQATD